MHSRDSLNLARPENPSESITDSLIRRQPIHSSLPTLDQFCSRVTGVMPLSNLTHGPAHFHSCFACQTHNDVPVASDISTWAAKAGRSDFLPDMYLCRHHVLFIIPMLALGATRQCSYQGPYIPLVTGFPTRSLPTNVENTIIAFAQIYTLPLSTR